LKKKELFFLCQARAGIREVHFNVVDKRTALTYIDSNGDWHRVSKGTPEQVTKTDSVLLLSRVVLD